MLNYKGETTKKIMPLLLGGSMIGIFLLYNIVENSFLFLLGIGVFVCAFFLLNIYQLLLMMFFLAPSLMSMRMVDNQTAWFGYLMLMVAARYFLERRLSFSATPTMFFLHCIFALITILIYSQWSLGAMLFRNLVFFVFLYSLFKEDERVKQTDYQVGCINAYVIGVVVNLIVGFLYYLAKDMDIFGGLFAGIRNDRNYFSSILSMAIGLILLFLDKEKKGIKILGWTACILFLLFGGGVSQSRTFFISLIFIVLEFLIFIIKKKDILIMIISLAVGLALIIFMWPVFQSVLERFEADDVVGANGRLELWAFYISLTASSPLRAFFGNGSASYYIATGAIDAAEHNSYIQSFSTFGILGSITLVLAYIQLYKAIVNNNQKVSIMAWCPLLAALVCYAMISSLYSDQFNFAILVGFLAINVFSGKKKECDRSVLLGKQQNELIAVGRIDENSTN